MDDSAVLRDDDPRLTELLAEGWAVVGESWGARLLLADDADLAPYEARVSRVAAAGILVTELLPEAAADLHALEEANHADYPWTPATAQPVLDRDGALALWDDGGRVFGARLAGSGELVGATATSVRGTRAETEFTSVKAGYRGRGVAVAVKAASVVALWRAGARVFGTGGAAVNAGSLAMNRALGYVVTERWLSLEPPAA